MVMCSENKECHLCVFFVFVWEGMYKCLPKLDASGAFASSKTTKNENLIKLMQGIMFAVYCYNMERKQIMIWSMCILFNKNCLQINTFCTRRYLKLRVCLNVQHI